MNNQFNMHRVLSIPELLDVIFSFTDEHANARSAQVCKLWSNVALDSLWRHVERLGRLFGLLAPLIHVEDGQYYFGHAIEPHDWTRFHSYARRVRYLTVDNNGDYPFSNALFSEVARTRQTLSLLPNLIHLKLLTCSQQSLHFSVMFLHENLSRLTVNLPVSSNESIRTFFEEIAVRTPKLTFLDLRMSVPARLIESELIALLKGQTRLKMIVVPRYTITANVFSALSTLPNLGTIQFEYFNVQGMGELADVVDFSPTLQPGAFPSLYDLSFHAKLTDASRLFNASFAPTNITHLFIHTTQLETSKNFAACLSLLSETCHMLTYLGFDLCVEKIEQTLADQSPSITFDQLRPIMAFPNLTTFELAHQRPLIITEDDLAELARKWPSLEGLRLNPEPITLDKPQLMLSALVPLALHCPRLRNLGLHIDATACTQLPAPAAPFAKLEKLEFGTSPITDPNPVAVYLSQFFPQVCEVISGVAWPDDLQEAIDGGFMAELQERWKHWDWVESFLPLLTALRMEEREKMCCLRSEVEDLRMRVRVLEDQGAYPREAGCIPV